MKVNLFYLILLSLELKTVSLAHLIKSKFTLISFQKGPPSIQPKILKTQTFNEKNVYSIHGQLNGYLIYHSPSPISQPLLPNHQGLIYPHYLFIPNKSITNILTDIVLRQKSFNNQILPIS